MNIKTANNLLNYRKSAGLSQEELAEKIGVSRQAVSKWERAEASPDTDNLISLADVFGVTLDELIKGKTETETELKDNINNLNDKVNISFKNGVKVESKGGYKVHTGWKGIHVESPEVNIEVNDKDGSVYKHITPAEVHINKHGVTVKGADGNVVYKGKGKNIFQRFPYAAVGVIAYILFGIFNICGGWAFGWLVLLTIPLYYTLVSAITSKNASHFAYPVLLVLLYLYGGFYHSFWHPGWIMFLTIPIYYFLCEFLQKIYIHNKKSKGIRTKKHH